MELVAYTDGACSGNPGPGGWGAILEAHDGGALVKTRELAGGESPTTNNRMELMAAIAALEALERPSTLTVVTDSVYLRDGITVWIHGWKRNGWRTAARAPVKNADLWQRLDAARAAHTVTWTWVKGHAGHPQNERADALARAEIARLRPPPSPSLPHKGGGMGRGGGGGPGWGAGLVSGRRGWWGRRARRGCAGCSGWGCGVR